MSSIRRKTFARTLGDVLEGNTDYLKTVIAHGIIQDVLLSIDSKQAEAKEASRYYQVPDITAPVSADAQNFIPCRLQAYPEVYEWACELRDADLEKHAEGGSAKKDSPIEWSWPQKLATYLLTHTEHATGIAHTFNPKKHVPDKKYVDSMGEFESFVGMCGSYDLTCSEGYEDLCVEYLDVVSSGGYKSILFTHITPLESSDSYNSFLSLVRTLASSIPVGLWIACGGFHGAVVCSPYGIDCTRANVVKFVKLIDTMGSSGWGEFQRYVKMGASTMESIRNLTA